MTRYHIYLGAPPRPTNSGKWRFWLGALHKNEQIIISLLVGGGYPQHVPFGLPPRMPGSHFWRFFRSGFPTKRWFIILVVTGILGGGVVPTYTHQERIDIDGYRLKKLWCISLSWALYPNPPFLGSGSTFTTGCNGLMPQSLASQQASQIHFCRQDLGHFCHGRFRDSAYILES